MNDFMIKLPDFIFFGKDSMNNLNRVFKKNIKNVLIITGKRGAMVSGALNELLEVLRKNKVEYKIFDEIKQNPDTKTVNRGGELARKINPDFIVAVGGGSVMDAAKGIAIVNYGGGSIWDYVYDGEKKAKKITGATPLIAIPTLAASGSEADAGAVFTNSETKEKIPVGSLHIVPKYSVVNPEYTYTVGPQQTAYGVMDIFSHLMETFISTRENTSEFADSITISMIKVLMKALPIVLKEPENYRWRAEIMLVSTLAISGIPSAGRKGSFILHYLEHPLSGHFNIPHGKGLSALLIPYLNLMKEVNHDRVNKFLNNLFNTDIETGLRKLDNWRKSNMLSVNLADDGITSDDIEKLSNDCIKNYSKGKGYLGGFEEFDKDKVIAIYKELF